MTSPDLPILLLWANDYGSIGLYIDSPLIFSSLKGSASRLVAVLDGSPPALHVASDVTHHKVQDLSTKSSQQGLPFRSPVGFADNADIRTRFIVGHDGTTAYGP